STLAIVFHLKNRSMLNKMNYAFSFTLIFLLVGLVILVKNYELYSLQDSQRILETITIAGVISYFSGSSYSLLRNLDN
ncbi:MAG: hypothetical protein AAGD05_19105, partial [Bacteroidota bacterium]